MMIMVGNKVIKCYMGRYWKEGLIRSELIVEERGLDGNFMRNNVEKREHTLQREYKLETVLFTSGNKEYQICQYF